MRSRRKPDWGKLGDAMRALPNDRWRAFVYHYVTGRPGHGAITAAARAAGFGRKSTPAIVAKIGWQLSHDDRTIAAIAEESRKIIRAGGPEAANAVLNLVRDPSHKDHGRALEMVLSRCDPVETRSHHSVDVTHKIVDPDREALEELRALRMLGTPRAKLLEIYGPNGLDRIEALEASDRPVRGAGGKVIEADFVDVTPLKQPAEETI
jgi:hypothetical protein